MRFSFAALCAVMTLGLSSAATAAVVVNTWEDGGNVEIVYSGTLDTTGLSFSLFTINDAVIRPDLDVFVNLFGDFDYTSGAFTAVTGAAGPGSEALPTLSLGDSFALSSSSGGELGLPRGYVSGSSINGGMTFAGATLSSLGFNTGDVVYTLSSADTITWKIGVAPAAVPLPAGLPLVIGGLGALGFLRLRRKS